MLLFPRATVCNLFKRDSSETARRICLIEHRNRSTKHLISCNTKIERQWQNLQFKFSTVVDEVRYQNLYCTVMFDVKLILLPLVSCSMFTLSQKEIKIINIFTETLHTILIQKMTQGTQSTQLLSKAFQMSRRLRLKLTFKLSKIPQSLEILKSQSSKLAH